jgi:predicted transposase YbfD/YdcC
MVCGHIRTSVGEDHNRHREIVGLAKSGSCVHFVAVQQGSRSAPSPSRVRSIGLGGRRFPGELRLPGATTIIRVKSRTELKDHERGDTRYYISSAALLARQAADAVRGHWGIENRLHWVLDVVFNDDQSRLRKGNGAKNMAVVRHFAINLLRQAKDKRSLKNRRKVAGRNTSYLATLLGILAR